MTVNVEDTVKVTNKLLDVYNGHQTKFPRNIKLRAIFTVQNSDQTIIMKGKLERLTSRHQAFNEAVTIVPLHEVKSTATFSHKYQDLGGKSAKEFLSDMPSEMDTVSR